VYLAWWSLHGQHPVALWHRHGAHAFWPGFDLVLASIISWTPLVADYTRFSRSRSAGFWGAGLGYFVPTIPLFALGAVIAMSRHISEAPALLIAIAAGGAASILALLALTVDESDEAFANVYSGAVSLQNLMPSVPQRLLVGGFAATATVGALLVDLRNYQPFLYLLGSFFVPLFAVLLAGNARCLARRLQPLPVAVAARARLVDEDRRPLRSARLAVGRGVAAKLRRSLRARSSRTGARQARTC
jgi:purine-cytosine permease-like protein